MATAPSLFGATPESIQQARDAALNQEANAYAQQDPFQRASAGLYRGGNQLGGAIGRMLGGQDPQMLQVQKRQELVRGVNPNNLASIADGIQKAMASNDYPAAQELSTLYKTLEESQTKTGLDRLKALETQATIPKIIADTASKEFAISPFGRAEALAKTGKFTSESITSYLSGEGELQSIDKFTKPTADFISKANEFGFGDKPNYGGYTPEQTGLVNAALLKEAMSKNASGASKTTINNVGENEFNKQLGGGQSKALLASQGNAQDAANIIETNITARDLLKEGTITGTGADFFVALNNGLKQAGIDFGFADASANSQAYTAALGANVGRIIKQFGAGTGLSDADRAYAAQMAGGNIAITRKALEKILDINDRAARGVIERHNKVASGVKSILPLTVKVPTGKAKGALGTADNPIKLN